MNSSTERARNPRVGRRMRRLTSGILVAVLSAGGLVAVALASPVPAAADVTTNSADNLRTGWYGNQPALSPAAVGAADFGQLGSMAVAGQVYAQPIISNNVLLASTELNNIYGFNATTRAQLWTRNLGTPFDAVTTLGCSDIKPLVGITSTPVVDPATGTEYVMSKVGAPSVAWYLHAIDITNGAERAGWPVLIQGVADNDATLRFSATNELQRPGLLLMNGVVYAGFAGHCDRRPFQGWITGVSTSTHQITAMWSGETAPHANAADGPGAGIWQSGAGLVSDASGDILVAVGNGTPPPTGPATVGESALGQTLTRLRVQPGGTLKEVDYFAPYDASVLNVTDSDVGSGGPVALPPQYFGTAKYPRLTVLVGKQGYIWLNDATHLGGVGQGPGGGDQVVQRSLKLAGGVRGKPGIWPGDGGYVYIATSAAGAGSGRLLAFKYGVDGSGNPTLAQTGKSAAQFGFGSGSPVITSNGTAAGSALVWVVRFAQTYDPTQAGVGAVLDVYNAVPNGGSLNAGNMTLVKSFPLGQGTKFGVPAVDNGHVFVGTSDGRVVEFGSPVSAPLTAPAVSFPVTTQGTSRTQTVTVTAQQTVTVTGASINNPQFTAGSPTPALPVKLTAGQSVSFPLTFSPTTNGDILAALTLATSAGSVPIQISGQGQTIAPKLAQGSCCVSFGGVAVGGQPTSDSVTFSNAGSADLIINGYNLPAAPFTVSGLPPVGTHLVSGQSVTATFTFAPQNAGLFTDQLLIHTNDPTADFPADGKDGSPNAGGVSLSGSAGTQGVMRIVPKQVSFGDVPVGTTATQPFTITNTGGTDLNITISKEPGGLNGFTAASSLPEGTVIAPGQTVTERVAFTPAATGRVSATWAITGDDGAARQDVTFTGNGVPAAPPTISISDLDVNRLATPATTVQLPVHLSGPSSTTVTVKYATKNGTAIAPGDYTTSTGTVTFAPGATSATIPIVVNGTVAGAAGKTLTVNLTAPTGATISDPSGKLYLNSTLLPVSIAVGDSTAVAAAAGVTNLNFPVTVKPAPRAGQTFTVGAATADGTALSAAGDYTPLTTSLTFTSTTPTQIVTVHVLHQPVPGATKTVLLTLNSASTGGQIGDASGLGTVYTNTPPLPALSVSDTALVRPATGTAAATFTLSLSRPTATPVSVSYAAVPGTRFTTADFVATNGTLIFQPGVTTQAVTVPINGSANSVGTGNVYLNLSGPTGATVADAGGKAYVVSPVAHTFVSVRPATGWRSPSDDTSVNVPITLDRPAPVAITIPVSTVDGSAKAGVDYSSTQTSVTIPAGSTQALLPVTIKAITAVSPTVAFSVKLGAPAGAAQVSSGTATVTIVSHTADATVPTTRSAPMFTTTAIPVTAQVGQLYNATVSASGVPEPGYSVTSGKLPAGITLNARTGQLGGTPTTVGTFTFTIGASNTVGTPASTGPLHIQVVAPNAPAVFTASTPPTSSKVGTPYTYTLAASGNPKATFLIVSGKLPPGIGLVPLTGVLSGSTTVAGSYTFTASAANAVGAPAVTKPITITVAAAAAP